MLHVPADRSLVDAQLLDDVGRTRRTLPGQEAEDEEPGDLQLRVDGPRPLDDHPADATYDDAHLLLERAQGLDPVRHRRAHRTGCSEAASAESSFSLCKVVRSGTSLMNSTHTKAMTANGTATRNR